MISPLTNDAVDDQPDKVSAEAFTGFDLAAEPTALADGICQGGLNVWCDVDLLVQTRPALRFASQLTRATLGDGPHAPRGAGYYDVPGFECVLVSGDGKLYEVLGAGNNVTANVLAPTPSATAKAVFAQLVGTMFWCDGTLHHSTYAGGAWTHGTVTTFDGGGAMPAWDFIVQHGGRVLAHDPATNKLYASAVGAASLPANWAATENIIVGDGVGDPLKWAVSGQNGLLFVVNERSAWAVDTSDANVANWRATRITALAGARAGETVVQIGQAIYFLSADGVVSLGALATSDSISPKATLGAPVKPILDRINAGAIGTAWATKWGPLYVLVVAIDDATTPNCLLCYHTLTGQWAPPWTATLPDQTVDGTLLEFAGFGAGVVTHFGDKEETLILDNTGRVLRLDARYEHDEFAVNSEQSIESWVMTKAFTHELPDNNKEPFLLPVEFFNSTASAVQVNLVRDGAQAYPEIPLAQCEAAATGLATNALQTFPIKFPFKFLPNRGYKRTLLVRGFNPYQNAAVQVVSGRGRLKLRAARLQSFIDSLTIT
jgi:hypothetical protein